MTSGAEKPLGLSNDAVLTSVGRAVAVEKLRDPHG